MGMYDRDYQHSEYGQQPGFQLRAPQTMVMKVVVFTFAVFLVQMMFDKTVETPLGKGTFNAFNQFFSLQERWYLQPWKFYQLLTYGFLHSTQDLKHILGNMFVLWMFGRYIEQRYGAKEFLAFYLLSIVVAGLGWSLCEMATGDRLASVLGASGGVSAILLLFIFNNPRVTLLLAFIVPVPAWVVGVLVLGSDVWGAMARAESSNVAFMAHLCGALFAFVYYKADWRVMNWVPKNWSMPRMKRGPKLRVHDPSKDDQPDPLEAEVDRLLKKIQEKGQDSLTGRERRILAKASRSYQKKRK